MRSGNPVLTATTLDSFRGEFFPASQAMTVQGAATKSLILLGLCIGAGGFTFQMAHGSNPGEAMPWMIGGMIAAAILGIVTSFTPSWSPVTAPLYALAEGLALGALSGMYEKMFNGIIPQAALATLGTMAAMLFAYKTGVIRATQGFIMGVTALLFCGTWYFFERTLAGRSFEAVALDRKAAALMGINLRRVTACAFAAGGAIAGLAALLLTPNTSAHYLMGIPLAIQGFTALVIGGVGRIEGALAGGLILSFAEQLTVRYAPIPAGLAQGVPLVLLIGFLLVRPQGLLLARGSSR